MLLDEKQMAGKTRDFCIPLLGPVKASTLRDLSVFDIVVWSRCRVEYCHWSGLPSAVGAFSMTTSIRARRSTWPHLTTLFQCYTSLSSIADSQAKIYSCQSTYRSVIFHSRLFSCCSAPRAYNRFNLSYPRL